MVLNHQQIHFGDICLIEKLIIQAPFRFTASFHNEACFIYFMKGSTLINSPVEQEPIAAEESVLLKCSNFIADLVKYKTADRYEIIAFHFYPAILRTIYANEMPGFVKSATGKACLQKLAGGDIIKKFITGLDFYFEHPALVSSELVTLKMKELILLLVQTKNADSIVGLFSDLFSPRTINLKEILNTHLFSPLSISDLAALANMSLSTFNRTFQSLFNDTPANYIKHRRLERAKELLAISALSVTEIASETCFIDTAHFSRSFKAVYEYSPTEYRSKLAKDNHG